MRILAVAFALAWAAGALAAADTVVAEDPAYVHKVIRDGSGNRALVSDSLVMGSASKAVRSFASHFGDWRFVGPLSAAYRSPEVVAADARFQSENPMAVEGFRFATDLHRPWFGRTSVARSLMAGADEIADKGEAEVTAGAEAVGEWHLLHAAVVNVRRGDAVRIAAACPPVPQGPPGAVRCGPPAPGGVNGTRACPGDVVALVVLNTASKATRQNDYGEITLFEALAPGAPGPADGVDSFAGARLRQGRAVVFPCRTPYRVAPPAVSTPKAVLLLRVVLTRDGARAAAAASQSRAAHAGRGNSLPERLGFPASLFPGDVVAAQEEAMAAVRAEDEAASAADSTASRAAPRPSGPAVPDLDRAEPATPEERLADEALAAANRRTKAAEAAARALADEGDAWAAPASASLNASSLEARVFETSGGRRVHVFDGLFADEASRAMLRHLRDHVVSNASYSFDDSTNEETADDTDNGEVVGSARRSEQATAAARPSPLPGGPAARHRGSCQRQCGLEQDCKCLWPSSARGRGS